MKALPEIPKNIDLIMRAASKQVANHERSNFYTITMADIDWLPIESPIEQALYVSMRMIQRLNDIHEMRDDKLIDWQNKIELNGLCGLQIISQRQIGRFRIDFSITYKDGTAKNGIFEERTVLIECDSQEFHDRSEPERRYEKRRDRFLQAAGFKIFRYTGAEILGDPFSIAAEILSYVCGGRKLITGWPEAS